LANILKKEESIRNIKSSNESKTLFELMVQNGVEWNIIEWNEIERNGTEFSFHCLDIYDRAE
jgi:hypothetical protein